MKTLKQNYRGIMAVAAVSITMMLITTGQVKADPIHNHYGPDERGYWDEQHHYHQFEYYHHQRGYWGERNGLRIFINL